jgi:hypothetical protein
MMLWTSCVKILVTGYDTLRAREIKSDFERSARQFVEPVDCDI